jgi:ferredoxin-NADP reductase
MRDCVRITTLFLFALLMAAPVQRVVAQEADEHAAHHPAGAAASTSSSMNAASPPAVTAAGAPQEPPMAGMAGMADMMEKMDKQASCCGPGQYNGPFVSRLLALPDLAPKAREELAQEAEARVHQGLVLAGAGAAEGTHATSPNAREIAARKLREGADLYASGAAGRLALEGGASGPAVATDWFRTQLSVGTVLSGAHAAHLFGLSPTHLLLMLFLALLSASLVGLQLFRLQRVRKLVGATPPGPVPGSVTNRGNAAPQVSRAADLAEAAKTSPTGPPTDAPGATGASPPKPRTWAGLLRIVQVRRETPSILTFRLADVSADRLPFDFLPGQFLQVEVEPEPGKAVRRSYTIATSPTQRAYVELSVKREEQGAVSRFLHDHVKIGDLVKVSGPFGRFTFTGSDAESIVLIAGGVGITPMMSVLRYLTDIAWPGEIFFVYGARSTEEFAFREDIERLERRHPNLHVFATMQRSPGTVWHGAEGPVTKEMLASAVPDLARRRIHLCGPPGMMAAMKAQLTELGVPGAQLYTEAFGPASLPIDPVEGVAETAPAPTGRANAARDIPSTGSDASPATITFSVSGVSAALPAEQTVLEAAEGAGVEIPYSCRAGTCGVCVTKLLNGEVTMAVESGLAPEDKAQGYILACQAKSTGAPLVVEA